jgi:hypothetical protein
MKIKTHIVLPLLLLLLTACNDAWDEHYRQNSGSRSEKSLFQLIQSDAQLSTFAAMLVSTGYDTLLSKPVTYTVWAPVNSRSLDSIAALNDVARNREVVQNHISRFAYNTSGLSSTTIFMLNRKFVNFKRQGSGYLFGGQTLISERSGVAAANGILHTLSTPVPYMLNLWEFILKTPGLDSLRTFLDANSVYAFDPKASVEIGTNEFGQSVYDSVITFSNPLLEKIGYLHLEDSVYTILLPDNKAWKSAYQLISNKYKTQIKDGGSIMQRKLTREAIVNNLVFRSQDADKQDSIVSTSGSIFRSPARLFTGASKNSLSNGTAWITDSLRFTPAESWHQPIIIEAENSDYGRSFVFANLFVRSGLGTPFSNQVSETRYLLIESTTVTTTQPAAVTFPIPNVLSGKYRIYCVFLPSSIVSETDLRPYKMRFYVTHTNSSGTIVENAPVGSANQLLATNRTANIFTSTGAAISKMFVTEIEFPFSNIYSPGAAATTITTRLKVENAVTTVEEIQNRGDRKMRIDYIILEPVQ